MAFARSGMDISIHTLTGAIFDLRVSPFESLISIKSKLERLEGIPISQQHLIWQSIELANDACLHDYGIKNGATLTLVLAMKDGPVNMRRVAVETPAMDGVELLMNDNNKEELWDQLMTTDDKKHVTFLVFCEGEQMNFFRVCERNEGESASPYPHTGLISANDNGEDELVDPEKQKENFITKDKMKMIRQQIESKCIKKEARIIQASRPPSTALPSANLTNRALSSRDVPSQCSTMYQCSTTPNAEDNSNMFVSIQITPSPIQASPDPQLNNITRTPLPQCSQKTPLPAISEKETDDKGSTSGATTDCSAPASSASQKSNNKNTGGTVSGNNISKHTNVSRSSKHKTDKKGKKMKEKYKPGRAKKTTLSSSGSPNTISPLRPASGQKERDHCSLPELNSLVLSNSNESNRGNPSEDVPDDALHLPDIEGDPKDNRTNLLNWVQSKRNERLEEQTKNHFTAYSKGVDSIGYYHERSISRLRSAASNIKCLPPIHNDNGTKLPAITGKKKLRCLLCTKKLGLATTYHCRCEGTFCAKHRYPETHTCTFDYKTEGRRILERNNPVVTAPKLPKI